MTQRILLLSLGASLALTMNGRCEEAPADVKVAGYHLQSRSKFSATPGARAPFWPIGWTPSSKQSTSIEAPMQNYGIKPEQFNVTSILLGSQSLAVINGRTYGEGEYIRGAKVAKPAEGAAPAAPAAPVPPGAKIRVMKITDGSVTLQAGNQALTVPLKRQQLIERKSSDDDLLSQVGDG